MRIGFVTSALSSDDGWARYSKSLIESVAKHADVSVLVEKDAANESTLPNVYRVLPPSSFHPRVQWNVCGNVQKYLKGCDLVHSLIEPFAPGAAFGANRIHAKFLMTLHGTYSVPPSNPFSIRRALLKYAYRSTAMTTTGSKYTEQKTREQVKFGECRFIPNGVDTESFHLTQDPPAAQPFILTVGAVKPRKGADITLEAFGLLKDVFSTLQLVIVGDTSNTGFVEKLKQYAEVLGVSSDVHILGKVSDAQLLKLYNTCTAFVLAARDSDGQFEGFPMVFYEANACGAPVITTKGFGSEYAIKDGHNGFLTDMERPDQIAEKVHTLLLEPLRRNSMREAALEEAADHTWDKIAERFLMPMYRDTLAQK